MSPRIGSNVAGAIPGETENVNQSIIGSADGPMVPDSDDPATPTVTCDDVGPMISAPVTVPVIPGNANPWREWHLSMSLENLITRFSSSEIRDGSLLANSTHVLGDFVP